MRWVILTHRYYSHQDPTAHLNPPTNERRFYPVIVSVTEMSVLPLIQKECALCLLSQSVRPSGNSIFHFYITFLNFENGGFSALRHFGRFVRVRLIRIHFSCFPILKATSPTTRMIWIMDNLVPPQNMPKLSCS